MRAAVLLSMLSALGLTACDVSSPLSDNSGVAEASQLEVALCTPLSVITTTLGISGTIGRDKALEIARNETKTEAASSGADTVVWEAGGPGSDDLFVRASTYRCV